MLQIKNLTITHKKDLRELIRGLSFTLNAGDKIAVIGEEGNGKSTLLKLIFDERLTEDYAEYTGEIHKAGLRLGYLSQELTPEQKRRTIYEFCADQPGFLDLSPERWRTPPMKWGYRRSCCMRTVRWNPCPAESGLSCN